MSDVGLRVPMCVPCWLKVTDGECQPAVADVTDTCIRCGKDADEIVYSPASVETIDLSGRDDQCPDTVAGMFVRRYAAMLESLGRLNPEGNYEALKIGITRLLEGDEAVKITDALGIIVLASLLHWTMDDGPSICEVLDSSNDTLRAAFTLTAEDFLPDKEPKP